MSMNRSENYVATALGAVVHILHVWRPMNPGEFLIYKPEIYYVVFTTTTQASFTTPSSASSKTNPFQANNQQQVPSQATPNCKRQWNSS